MKQATKKPTKSLAAGALAAWSVPAWADMGNTVGAGVGVMIYNMVRNHPLAFFVGTLTLLALVAILVWSVIRRVRTEARGYVSHGREAWSSARNRVIELYPRGKRPIHDASHEERQDIDRRTGSE